MADFFFIPELKTLGVIDHLIPKTKRLKNIMCLSIPVMGFRLLSELFEKNPGCCQLTWMGVLLRAPVAIICAVS